MMRLAWLGDIQEVHARYDKDHEESSIQLNIIAVLLLTAIKLKNKQ